MIIELIREHQLNIMLELSSVAAIILIFSIFSKFISKDKKKAIIIMAISSFILLRADRLAYIYRGDITTLGYYMVRICNYLVFATSLSLIYGFTNYLITYYKNNDIKELGGKILFILKTLRNLILLGEILLIISQFTNLYYYFDDLNIYHRGKFFIVCYIIPLICLIVQFIVVLITEKKINNNIFISLLLFTLIPILATIIQIFCYGVSLTNMSSVGVVVLLYGSTLLDANKSINEKNKLQNELRIAKSIQLNECPNTFPAFPDRREFDLYAYMNPAKEVGGDFYDYFLLDDNHLGLVIADVSGKGVPAALNMVKAKLLLKGTGLYINNPAKVLSHLNDGFIDNNKLDMFVTVWFGILEITTGKLTFANAGHEDPIIYNSKTGFTSFKTKHGIPIGVMQNYEYENHEVKLNKGDKLFLFTDGIVDLLNTKEKHPDVIINNIKNNLIKYSKGREQFDDITMLCIELLSKHRKANKIELKGKFNANVKEIDKVYEYFTDSMAEIVGIDKIKKYYIVIDEIFSNIAKYGYKDIKDGREEYISIELHMDLEKKKIKIIFEDNGIPFDPTSIMDPNTNKQALDREIGGLGIFIVKKMMDKVTYEYKNERNVLTIEKMY